MNSINPMPKTAVNQAVQVWEGISRAHCSIATALEKDMLPATGISVGWYEVLARLNQAPDSRMRFQDLARVVGITDSGASRRLNLMISAGLIDRFLCPSDRRGVYAHLTDKGRTTYARAHAVFVRSLERNLSHLGPGEAELVRSALSRLTPTG
ncbi:MAG: MarR family transcriptional regulator [Candidatus Dormibacteraceae bacterium]